MSMKLFCLKIEMWLSQEAKHLGYKLQIFLDWTSHLAYVFLKLVYYIQPWRLVHASIIGLFSREHQLLQQPSDDSIRVKQVATSPTKKKKATRNRQKLVTQTEPAPRQTAWTTKEEIVLAKGWRSISENSERESGDASINLNNTDNDEDDVQEIRRPEGRDKAKNKGSKASGSSTMNDDALARLMVTEIAAAEVAQREKFMELKRREVECREREIAAAEYRAQQEDMKLYLQPYEHLTGDQRLAMDAIRAQIKAKYITCSFSCVYVLIYLCIVAF
ncbi:hypothetical protein Tco_0929861 [Tanacetum coccineum]